MCGVGMHSSWRDRDREDARQWAPIFSPRKEPETTEQQQQKNKKRTGKYVCMKILRNMGLLIFLPFYTEEPRFPASFAGSSRPAEVRLRSTTNPAHLTIGDDETMMILLSISRLESEGGFVLASTSLFFPPPHFFIFPLLTSPRHNTYPIRRKTPDS